MLFNTYLASINVYLNFGDLEYDSYKRMYSKMNEEIYKNEILKVKEYFNISIDKLDSQRGLYYILVVFMHIICIIN